MKTKHMRIPHKSTCGPHKQDETASLATQTPGLATLNPRIKSHKAFQIRITSPRKHDRAIPQGARRPHACHGAATDPRAGESPKKERKDTKNNKKTQQITNTQTQPRFFPSRPLPLPHASAILPRCNNLMHFITLVIGLYIPRVASESPDPAVKSAS